MRESCRQLTTVYLMDVSIIIVNWNSIDYLRECVGSIYEHTEGIRIEIIVVDNASPAGDAELIEKECQGVRLIKSRKNLGFAGANNLGFKYSSGAYVLFLNPDTILTGPAINVMLGHCYSLQDAGIVGCRLLNGDLSVQTSSIQRFPTILNQMLQSERLRLRWPSFPLWGIGALFSDGAAPAKVESISGACMMIRREVFAGVKCFSEDYFMYSEDLDLCYKVKRSGYTNYYVGDASIIHFAGRSSRPEWALIMKCRSDLRFCAQNRGRAYAVLFRVAMIANAMARLAVIGALSAFREMTGDDVPLREKRTKWWVVLKTLLTSDRGFTSPENLAKCAASEKGDSVVL